MRRTSRYEMVLYGNPPHDPVAVLRGMIDLVDRLCGVGLDWHLHNHSECAVPRAEEAWTTLVKDQTDRESGALYLSLDAPIGCTMSLGANEPPYVRTFDVLSLGFDSEHLSGSKALFGFDGLLEALVEGTRLFGAFSGEVSDRELVRKDKAGKIYLSVDVSKVPDIIHWFNYFDSEMVERLGGKDKLLKAPAYLTEELADPPGIILVLQREPFDYHNPEHRQRWRKMTEYLNLDHLHRLYPRQS